MCVKLSLSIYLVIFCYYAEQLPGVPQTMQGMVQNILPFEATQVQGRRTQLEKHIEVEYISVY